MARPTKLTALINAILYALDARRQSFLGRAERHIFDAIIQQLWRSCHNLGPVMPSFRRDMA